MITTPTLGPISAVTSADPYPYYRGLVADRPFAVDDDAGLWVESSAAAVSAVLASPALGVRPPDAPVPAGIVGTAAGEVFGRLVRMIDGERHATAKPLVATALGGVDGARATVIATRWAQEVLAGDPEERLSRLLFAVPAGVVGELCGLSPQVVADVGLVELTRQFVGCIPASATAADQAAAAAAAATLSDLLRPMPAGGGPGLPAVPLPVALRRAADAVNVHDPQMVLANTIGLLSQTYDATAGLIGNTLLAWRRDRARGPVELTTRYVLEVARHDAPVQNTRRFAHRDTVVLGRQVRRGEAVLAVLAAANRDPAVNPDPDRFDPDRRGAHLFTFGLGAHSCPGRALAVVIATAVVRAAIDHGLDAGDLPTTVHYRALPNARIPEFGRRP